MKRCLALLISGCLLFGESVVGFAAPSSPRLSDPLLVQTQAVVQALRASRWVGGFISRNKNAALMRAESSKTRDLFRNPWEGAIPLRFHSDAAKTFTDIVREVNQWTVKKLLTQETRFNQVRNSEELAEGVSDGDIVDTILTELVQRRDPRARILEERLQEAIRVEAVRQAGDGLRISGISPFVAAWIVQHEPYFHDIDPPFATHVTFNEIPRAQAYYLERLGDVLFIRPEGHFNEDSPLTDKVSAIRSALQRLKPTSSSTLFTHPVTMAAIGFFNAEFFDVVLIGTTIGLVFYAFYTIIQRMVVRGMYNFMFVLTPKKARSQFKAVYLEPIQEDFGVLLNEWITKPSSPIPGLSSLEEWGAPCLQGFQVRSVDQQGVSHLEGWVTYKLLPFGIKVTQLEIAPWNVSEKSPRLFGVAPLLNRALWRESFKSLRQIRLGPDDPWWLRVMARLTLASFWVSPTAAMWSGEPELARPSTEVSSKMARIRVKEPRTRRIPFAVAA